MLDEKAILELMDQRISVTGLDLDFDFEGYVEQLVELLGDDEGDILDFMESVDDKYTPYFDEIYEEVIEKFPSNEMEEMFERYR